MFELAGFEREIDPERGIDATLLGVDSFGGKQVGYKMLEKVMSKVIPEELTGDAIWKSKEQGFIEFAPELVEIEAGKKIRPITLTEDGKKRLDEIKKQKEE